MGCLRGTLLPGINLHHLRYIQRIHSGEWVRRNQDNTTVCVNLLLCVSELDGLEDCGGVSWWSKGNIFRRNKPAGSFRCDKFVRSSLASSIAGFMSGGRFGLLSTWSSACVVSTVFVYSVTKDQSAQCSTTLMVNVKSREKPLSRC